MGIYVYAATRTGGGPESRSGLWGLVLGLVYEEEEDAMVSLPGGC